MTRYTEIDNGLQRQLRITPSANILGFNDQLANKKSKKEG